MRGAVVCLASCLGVVVAPMEARNEGVTPFHVSPHGGVVVAVHLDGRGPFRMIVDTGSTHSVITARVAAEIGATSVAQAELTTTAGSDVLPVVVVECLEVGPVSAALMPTVVSDLPAPGEADGLLGLDVLADRHFTIDYGRRLIVWHDDIERSLQETAPTRPEGAADADAVRLDIVQGRFVVEALVNGHPVSLVVDSGSETLVLFNDVSAVGTAGRTVNLATLVRRVPGGPGMVRTLRIGRAEQRHVPAVHVARPHAPGDPAGLLATRGFSRVTFDGPGRRLIVRK